MRPRKNEMGAIKPLNLPTREVCLRMASVNASTQNRALQLLASGVIRTSSLNTGEIGRDELPAVLASRSGPAKARGLQASYIHRRLGPQWCPGPAGRHLRPLATATPRLCRRCLRRRQHKAALAAKGRWPIEIINCSDQGKGFEVLPRRWIIERTFA